NATRRTTRNEPAKIIQFASGTEERIVECVSDMPLILQQALGLGAIKPTSRKAAARGVQSPFLRIEIGKLNDAGQIESFHIRCHARTADDRQVELVALKTIA